MSTNSSGHPSPDESEFAFVGYRRMGNDLLVMIKVYGVSQPYNLKGIESLASRHRHDDFASFFLNIYQEMRRICIEDVPEILPCNLEGDAMCQMPLCLDDPINELESEPVAVREKSIEQS